jgi:aryl-alcohol dehydrogenase-like predicted oxidoreductase
MRYRTIGDTDLVVSVLGLGGNNFGGRSGADQTREVVDAALECGITLFDTADNYGGGGGSETLLGEMLPARRDQVVIATKFGADMRAVYGDDCGSIGSGRYVRRAVAGSLSRLRADYIDLYQMHMPDPAVPLAETIGALQELVREGKIRHFGHSNLPAWQVAEAHFAGLATGQAGFVTTQNQYSLLTRDAERELLPACRHFGVGFLAYFPLDNGLLTGKVRPGVGPAAGTRLHGYESYMSQDKLERIEALAGWAAARGLTLLEVALGSLAARPGVHSAIAGASSRTQVLANAAAVEWMPSRQDLEQIDELAPAPADIPRLSDLRKKAASQAG